MNMISRIAAIWTLSCLLIIPSGTSSDYDVQDVVPQEFTYDRIREIDKQCGFVIDSATELQRDDSRLHTIKEELIFENGDWWQDLNGAPLLTFDDSFFLQYNLQLPSKLVSFGVNGVNRHYHSNKSIYISGVMQIGISANNLLTLEPFLKTLRSYDLPRQDLMFVGYQGIYTESEENNGERVMCLLGSTLFLPSHQPDSSILVLRYPRKFTLRSGVVSGFLKSLNNKSNHEYFDDVRIHISSCLGNSANYEFSSESLVSKACDPYPFKDSLVDGGTDIYKELNFFVLLKRFTIDGVFTILPNWKCNGTDDSCSKFGPFVFDTEIKTRDLKFIIRDVRCDKMTFQDDGNVGNMKIYLVLKVVPPYDRDASRTQWRTGFSNMTISAEGTWKSSSGQLCMIGCHGDDYKCDVRICLYVPLSISINQQALMLGTLTSTDHTSISHFGPLPFERQVSAIMAGTMTWDEEYIHPHPIYEYSKHDDARVVREKDKPDSLGNFMRKSFLGFPKIKDLQQFPYSLSVLANNLLFPLDAPSEDDIVLEIDFIGPLFGRCCFPQQNISSFAKENHDYFDISRYTDKHLLLNVSGQLKVPSLHSNLTSLSVEGIYDPLIGKMYLIGCQDSSDCFVEVVISYPPTTAYWLLDPEASIHITSTREKDDPFYFRPIKLQSGPLSYNQGSVVNISPRGLEVVLSILMLSLAITCVLSQLFYVKDNIESAPYISLVMVGVQALGYGLPLITGSQVIFRNLEKGNDWETRQWIRISDHVAKLLVLAAFLLTMRLFHMVWRSRVRMLRQTLPERVPNEKKVCLATLAMYIVGNTLYLTVHFAKSTSESPQSAPLPGFDTEYSRVNQLVGEVGEYLALVHDLFLVPQIIANVLWKIDCKPPLRRFYYAGMTFVRLVPHICYLVNPGFFIETHTFIRPEFDFSYMFRDIAITVTIVLLGFVIYIQQQGAMRRLVQHLWGKTLSSKVDNKGLHLCIRKSSTVDR